MVSELYFGQKKIMKKKKERNEGRKERSEERKEPLSISKQKAIKNVSISLQLKKIH